MSFRVRSSFTGVGRPRLVAASGQLPRTLVSGYPFKQGGWCRNFIEKKEWVKGSDEVSSQNDSEVTFIMNKIQSAQSEAITLSVEFGNLKKHYLRGAYVGLPGLEFLLFFSFSFSFLFPLFFFPFPIAHHCSSAEVRMSDQMFSCSTCRLWLSSVDEQRAHFQTPLHAFNVRRKVVNMVPVSQDQFDEKLAESQADSKAEKAASVPVVLACQACNKKFKSSEMLEQHLQSKKHIKAADGKSAEDVVVKKAVKVVSEETEEGGADAVEKRIEKGRRLGFLECIFCSKTSASAEETAEHMSECHSFFIPDVEYLVDLAGLLSYLGDKVGVGFCCVFCHRVFESVQAARQHMEALSHAKMVYGDDEDAEAGEFDEFYEFVST
jgi:hypothetical protein